MSMAPDLVQAGDNPVRCIVKLGGAAVTEKGELETINGAVLSTTAKQICDALGFSNEKKLSMDWSRSRESENAGLPDVESWDLPVHMAKFVVVHGAGSFGHFQASRAKVNLGNLEASFVKAGFVATRISVTTLNHQVVRAFATEGIPAVSLSPFSGGWSTAAGEVEQENTAAVKRALDAGLVPILHGDAVLDSSQGCRILSGDIIVRHLALSLKPSYVVFLTNVPGVFDRPPSVPGAVLLKEIVVEDGHWSIIDPPGAGTAVQTNVAAHDTTGGMATKIAEAASIASAGIPVFVVQAGSADALEALKGTVQTSREHWVGTVIRPSHS